MRIAVVGAGISGLVSAYVLARRHQVVLFEADARLGGHANTVDVPGGAAVDTGFIVFNRFTYPNFVRLLDELGVEAEPTEMSFSVRSDRRDFEYGGANIDALFAQRRHLLSPRFHRMWRDILRFYREARELLAPGPEIRLGQYLEARGYSEAFITDHLLPLVGAVWSSDRESVRAFPARLLVRFFDHHGFLQRGAGRAWLTIRGGSREYVRAVARAFRGDVRLSSPVARLTRAHGQVAVQVAGRDPERFDHVVLACHADDALRMVDAPTAREREVLGAFRFQANHAVLHTDDRLMPRRRRCWSAWNAHLDEAQTRGGTCMTYWMNRLQSLSGPTQYFVTLNRREAIGDDRVIAEFSYAHPVFTPEATEAQARHDDLIDHAGVSYCGAYWRNGFHEDGVSSALRVCQRLGGTV